MLRILISHIDARANDSIRADLLGMLDKAVEYPMMSFASGVVFTGPDPLGSPTLLIVTWNFELNVPLELKPKSRFRVTKAFRTAP